MKILVTGFTTDLTYEDVQFNSDDYLTPISREDGVMFPSSKIIGRCTVNHQYDCLLCVNSASDFDRKDYYSFVDIVPPAECMDGYCDDSEMDVRDIILLQLMEIPEFRNHPDVQKYSNTLPNQIK